MSSFELPSVFGGYGPTGDRLSCWGRCKRDVKPNEDQRRILWIIGVQLAVIVMLYQWRITRWILYPFELVGTVFHEFGHALMTWLSGGRVHSIDINMDESGLTRFSGGWPCLIIPAGYIGNTVAGCLLLFAGFNRKWSRYTAIAVDVILLLTLFWSGSVATLVISLVLIAGMAFVAWYQEGRYTQYFVLFMGTIASIVSLLNILSSTVFHTIDGSDAVAFAQHCSFLVPAFVYGIIWALLSIGLIAGALFLALIFQKA